MSRQLEQLLQEQFVLWLRKRGVLFCASAGGMRTNMRTAVKMKKAGYQKGFPDLIICLPRGGFHGMFIEVKCGTYPIPEQKRWQEELMVEGYFSIIVPGKLDFLKSLKFLKEATERYLEGNV